MNAAPLVLSLKKTALQAGAEFSHARKCFFGLHLQDLNGLVDLPSLLFVVLSDVSEHLGCCLSVG
jgi:hypothetical protein